METREELMAQKIKIDAKLSELKRKEDELGWSVYLNKYFYYENTYHPENPTIYYYYTVVQSEDGLRVVGVLFERHEFNYQIKFFNTGQFQWRIGAWNEITKNYFEEAILNLKTHFCLELEHLLPEGKKL